MRRLFRFPASLRKLPSATPSSALSASSARHAGNGSNRYLPQRCFSLFLPLSALGSASLRLCGGMATPSFLHHSTTGTVAKTLRFPQRLCLSASELRSHLPSPTPPLPLH